MSIELMLDTANIEIIKEEIENYPVSGITTNPDILSREKVNNPFSHLKEIKKIIGPNRSLHVQVTAKDTNGIIEDAHRIVQVLGIDTYVKIPVTKNGLAAMQILSKEKIKITATVIYTALQGLYAIMCGAEYLAVYLNKMLDTDIDPFDVIKKLSEINSQSKVLVASFRNMSQIVSSYANGAVACTVPPTLLDKGIDNALVNSAIDGFDKKWSDFYGNSLLSDFE